MKMTNINKFKTETDTSHFRTATLDSYKESIVDNKPLESDLQQPQPQKQDTVEELSAPRPVQSKSPLIQLNNLVRIPFLLRKSQTVNSSSRLFQESEYSACIWECKRLLRTSCSSRPILVLLTQNPQATSMTSTWYSLMLLRRTHFTNTSIYINI